MTNPLRAHFESRLADPTVQGRARREARRILAAIVKGEKEQAKAKAESVKQPEKRKRATL